MWRLRISLILIAVAWLAASCSEPSSREYFVKQSQCDSFGRYAFELALDDSLSTYSISLYTRIDMGDNDFISMTDPAVDILLVAPSGAEFSETVFLPKSRFVHNGILAKDLDVPYRTGFRPVEYGPWKMYLSLPEPVENLRGMGIKLSKN